MPVHIHEIDPLNLKTWVDNGQALLIDVREHLEYEEEHIPKAQLFPVSNFDPRNIPDPYDKKIVFYCLSGKRSASAAVKWAQHVGVKDVFCLQGGLECWKKTGLPTVVNLEAERKVEHQAYILAGVLTLFGSVCTALFGDLFLVVPIVVGGLLMYSGFVGHCYLSYLLSKLPFNR